MKFLKQKMLFGTLLFSALFLSACICTKQTQPVQKTQAVKTAKATQKSQTSAAIDKTYYVPTLSVPQKAYLAMPRKQRVANFADAKFRKAMQRTGYYPQGFTVTLPTLEKGKHVSYILTEYKAPAPGPLSKNVPSTPKKIGKATVPPYVLVSERKGKLTFSNLKIASQYLLTTRIAQGRKVLSEKADILVTESVAPRLVRINGVPNVRDLGGRMTLSGKRMRQGLVYRTAGLNNNASLISDRKKAIALYGEKILKEEKTINDEINLLKRSKTNPALFKFVSVKFNPSWTLFRPSMQAYKAGIAKSKLDGAQIPEIFLGVRGTTVNLNKSGRFSMPIDTKSPAVFMKVVEAPEDGYIYLTAGADWFWKMTCNGKTVKDLIHSGNGKAVSASNHDLFIKVKKGANLITVTVFTGSEGFAWCCKYVKGNHSKLADKYIKSLEVKKANLFKVRSAGKNRLNAATKKYLINDLGLRSDIDLRSDGECFGMTGSPAGKQVTWFQYSSSAYGGMRTKGGQEAFKKVFRVFLNEKNYPIAFHCIAGQDRTGAVAFIINGLLGVPEEELYLDWEATGFWNPSADFSHAKRFDHLVKVFMKYPGRNINEKIEAYVLSLGFSKADIAKLRSFLLEK